MFTTSSRCWVFAVFVMSLVITACSRKEPTPEAEPPRVDPVETAAQPLNPNPQVADFALYATNSISVQNSVVVNGADVGVKNTGSGTPRGRPALCGSGRHARRGDHRS